MSQATQERQIAGCTRMHKKASQQSTEKTSKKLKGSCQTTSLYVVPPQDRLRSSDESARQSQERLHALTVRDMSSICSKHAGTQLEASQNLRRKQGSKCHQQISAAKAAAVFSRIDVASAIASFAEAPSSHVRSDDIKVLSI